jgi:hypothetical protein
MNREITIDMARRIARNHGYKENCKVPLSTMLKICADAYAAGYHEAQRTNLIFSDTDQI